MSENTTRHEMGPHNGKLVVEGLVKRFGGLVAVDDLSFRVKEGEILAVIGPNGAGKSTTFNCVTGLYAPTEGTIWYDGVEITDDPMYSIVNRGLSRTFQSFRAFRDRTVLENIELSLAPNRIFSLSGLSEKTTRNGEEIARRVGLTEEVDLIPSELPHAGMIRLEVAKALAVEPEMVLLDEPFAGLSAQEVTELSDQFRELHKSGITLAIIDHNMHGLLTLADRVLILNFGSKLMEGTPDEIREDPDVRRAYLGDELE